MTTRRGTARILRRAAGGVLVAAAVALPVPASVQTPTPPEGKPGRDIRKGDTIVVRGCLTGSALEATDLGSREPAGLTSTSLTFRLTGDKALLKQLRDEHDGFLVEVEGRLRSDLPASTAHTRRIGKTRITIGSPGATPGRPAAEAARTLPVLEVKAFERRGASCAR